MARTVLYIDYNPRSIGRIRPVLLAMGLQVRLAHDGLIGIDMFHMHSPDLVLLQDLIPRKHGFEVCSEIKNTVKGQTTPVVLLTTLRNGKRREIPDTGCDAFLEEPVPERSLIEAIRKFIPEVESVRTAVDQGDHSFSSECQQIPFDAGEEEIDQKLDELIIWGQAEKTDLQSNKNEPSVDNPSADEKRKTSGRTSSRKTRPGKKKSTKKRLRERPQGKRQRHPQPARK